MSKKKLLRALIKAFALMLAAIVVSGAWIPFHWFYCALVYAVFPVVALTAFLALTVLKPNDGSVEDWTKSQFWNGLIVFTTVLIAIAIGCAGVISEIVGLYR